MFWLMVVVVAVVVFGIAAARWGLGGPSVTPRVISARGPSTRACCRLWTSRRCASRVKLRGYRMDAVDSVLDGLAEEFAGRDAASRSWRSPRGPPELAPDLIALPNTDREFPFRADAEYPNSEF